MTTSKNIPFAEFVALMAVLMSITALSIDTVLPALPMMGHDLGVDTANHTQYIIGTLFLGFTFGQFFYGPISDSFGRKPSIFAGLAIFIFGSVLSIFAHSFELMLIGRLLQGIGVSSPRIISVAMARDLYAGQEMARVMSFVMSIFIIVPALAPTIGQFIVHISHWRVIFIVLIAVALGAMAWAHIRLPETLSDENRRPFSIKSIFAGVKIACTNKMTITYTLCAGLVFGALIGYISSAQQIFQGYYNLGPWFPLCFAVSALAIGAASVVNAKIVRRYGMRNIVHYALLAMMLTSALMLGAHALMPSHAPLWLFMPYATITFFCVGLLFGNLNAIAMEPMGHLAGVASAVIGALSSIISVIAGTLIGQMYNDTLWPLIIGFLILTALCFVLQLPLRKLKFEEIKP